MDNKKIHISYTTGAENELKKLTEDLKQRIEDSLIKKKYVTGDSEIEITASDIEKIKNRITIKTDLKRERKFLLLGYTYIVIGVIFFLIAFFWKDIEYMLINDRINGIFGIVGVCVALIGALLTLYISIKTNTYIDDTKELKKDYTKRYETYYKKNTELYYLLLQKEIEDLEKNMKEKEDCKETMEIKAE